MSFPDPELVVCELLEDIAPAYTPDPQGKGPEFLADPADPGSENDTDKVRPPFILVAKTGGVRARLQDTSTVDVEFYGVGYAATRSMRDEITQRLNHVVGIQTAQGFVDRIGLSRTPTQVPYDAGPTRQNVLSCDVVSRNQ
jgi:hypothetical protein